MLQISRYFQQTNLPKLTAIDQQICHFGQLTLTARNKCIGLLPDIHKRAIYRQKGFASIYENMHVHTPTVKLSPEIESELLKLQQKGIDINALLKIFLQERREKIAKEKELLAKEQQQKATTRHMPIKIRRMITQEHGTKCAVPACKKPSKNLHHTDRFALTHTHNPYFIAPLCREHHEIAHVIDSKFTYEHSRK
jgi:hypothetical protein